MSNSDLAREERSTKAYKIRAFLTKPPRNAANLRLHTLNEDEESTVWASDERDEWKPELHQEIMVAMENYATETQHAQSWFKLRYETANGNELKCIKLFLVNDAQAQQTALMATPASELNGSNVATLSQMQRHQEAMMRIMLNAQVETMKMSREVAQHALDMCQQLATRIAETETQRNEAESRAEDFRKLAEKIQSAGTEEEKEKGVADFIELVKPMLPYVMQAIVKVPGGTA